MIAESCATRSLADCSLGHVKRGEIVRDGWNSGLYVGMLCGSPVIMWGLMNPHTDRFAAMCEQVDSINGIKPGSGANLHRKPRPRARSHN